jgi:hypothetical protein
MHRFTLPAALAVFALSIACGPDGADVCGVSSVDPDDSEIADGMGEALLDGSAFSNMASWAPGPNSSLDIGTLSMIIAFDETGTQTTDLLERRAFPICVPLGERSDTSGSAAYDGPYLTNATQNGGVALLGEEGGVLSGRFALDLVHNVDGSVISFTEGVFRAERR